MNWEKVLRLIHLTNFIMLEGQEALKLLLEENLSDFMMSACVFYVRELWIKRG